jgi:hypothetical protein
MYVRQYVIPVKKKKKSDFTILIIAKNTINASYKSVTLILYNKTRVLYQIPLSTKNVVDFSVLATHETNTPFSCYKTLVQNDA